MFTLCCTKRAGPTQSMTLFCAATGNRAVHRRMLVVKVEPAARKRGGSLPSGIGKASAGGPNLYTEPKSLETNIRLTSLAELYIIANEQVLHVHTVLFQKSGPYTKHDTLLCCDGQQSGTPKDIGRQSRTGR